MIAVAGKQKPQPGWVTRQSLAYTLGIGLSQIDRLRVAYGNIAEAESDGDAKLLIYADTWLAHHYAQRLPKRDKASEREFFGEDAEWQDKCWEEKFYALRDERLKRHEQIIAREDVHSFVTVVASEFRQLGERLQHAYGPDAQDMVNDTLDNIQHHAEATLTNGDGGT